MRKKSKILKIVFTYLRFFSGKIPLFDFSIEDINPAHSPAIIDLSIA